MSIQTATRMKLARPGLNGRNMCPPSQAVFDAVEDLTPALGSDDIAPLVLDAVRAGQLTL
jgi:hypothetical protein